MLTRFGMWSAEFIDCMLQSGEYHVSADGFDLAVGLDTACFKEAVGVICFNDQARVDAR
ncbi:hypothetical protein D3C77_281100 [compost metagenome]